MLRALLALSGLALLHPHAGPGGPTPARDTTVAIQGFGFRPGVVEVPPGSRVTWSNGDEIEHTVTAGVPDSVRGTFEGGLPAKGAAWSQTFTRPGRYPYYCARHPFMRGEVRVTTTGES